MVFSNFKFFFDTGKTFSENADVNLLLGDYVSKEAEVYSVCFAIIRDNFYET